MAAQGDGWSGMGGNWTDADDIRRRLDTGRRCSALRRLLRSSPTGLRMDALEDGVTALWEAVMSRKPANARALAAAGADPWRPSLGGWSPGRLSLAGPTPGLFPAPDGVSLTATERAAAQEAPRLTAALGEFYYDGTGLACVAGIDAAEAVRRLEATPVVDDSLLGVLNELLEDPYAHDMDESLHIVGVTSVPGGCVVTGCSRVGPASSRWTP
ncbi:hypothetical protein [Streptomyces sp. ATCC 21386]|uniref:hypothetical protein n=1 Tax=Streptomyces sp. ATCC 21386 TaxID=2699428 RepID=UPI0027E47D74|nr:hypothetical protein [Streptomyces sp. ATCC 21386]